MNNKSNIPLTTLKQAITCCVVNHDCDGCPFYRGPEDGPEPDCLDKLMYAAYKHITSSEESTNG
jgi:hypothetical protein